MIDIYIRTANAGILANSCPFLRGKDEETGENFWITSGEKFTLDIIGPIVKELGEYDDEGNEVKPPVIDQNFHVNLRCTEDIAKMIPASIIVTPENPKRVWA